MNQIFSKRSFFLLVFLSIGVTYSVFFSNSLSEKFLNFEETLMQVEVKRKVVFLERALAAENTAINDCLFNSVSSEDPCTQVFISHEGLWLYDIRIFRNDTLMFEKNANPAVAWEAWSKGQKLKSKNAVFTFDMKPTRAHLEFLESDAPTVFLLLGIFVSFAFTALIWFFQQLFIKKEELRKAQCELSSTNRTLKEKNSELEEYAYVVAHDLQEPLNTINCFIKVLREDHQAVFENVEVDQHFTLISNASSRMRTMIKELLMYAKIGQNRELESVDIKEVVDETIVDLTHLIKKSGAIINIPKDFPIIKGHRLELKLLFQNLIVNAVKYQKTGTRPVIDVFLKSNDIENKFTVQDNGIGIDIKYQDTIFKLFQRLHNSRKYTGSGIGLTKCKKILELHKGAIWVESTLNQGSKFHFTIPK